jgi:hypothetical protein
MTTFPHVDAHEQMRRAVGHAELSNTFERLLGLPMVAVLPSSPRVEPSNYLRQEGFRSISMHARVCAFVDFRFVLQHYDNMYRAMTKQSGRLPF